MSSKRSRVHPRYKTKYRVGNWPEYDRSLVERGNLTFWLSPAAVSYWKAKPSGRRGGQQKYSDLAIETALTLRLLFHLPLRQTEGFLLSIFELMGARLDAPDHTTLSRRSRQLELPLRTRPEAGPIDMIIDSSGLAIFGEGEWAAAKHGRKGVQGWKKLHLGVNRAGIIVAQALTSSNVDDATTGVTCRRREGNSGRSPAMRPTTHDPSMEQSLTVVLPSSCHQSRWPALGALNHQLEIEPYAGFTKSVDGSGRKRRATIDRRGSRTPSSDTRQSSVIDSELAVHTPRRSKLNSPATFSTA